MGAKSGEPSWVSRVIQILIGSGLGAALLIVPASAASACSIVVVELDELEAALANPVDDTFVGVVEAGVLHVWPETESFATARAIGLRFVWGEGPEEYGSIVGGQPLVPSTTSSCGPGIAEQRTRWWMAVYASDSKLRPTLIEPQPVFGDIAPLLDKRFGEPRAVRPPEFGGPHPSEPIVAVGDGDQPLSGQTTDSLSPPNQERTAARSIGFILAAIAVVGVLIVWIGRTRRMRSRDRLDLP